MFSLACHRFPICLWLCYFCLCSSFCRLSFSLNNLFWLIREIVIVISLYVVNINRYLFGLACDGFVYLKLLNLHCSRCWLNLCLLRFLWEFIVIILHIVDINCNLSCLSCWFWLLLCVGLCWLISYSLWCSIDFANIWSFLLIDSIGNIPTVWTSGTIFFSSLHCSFVVSCCLFCWSQLFFGNHFLLLLPFFCNFISIWLPFICSPTFILLLFCCIGLQSFC